MTGKVQINEDAQVLFVISIGSLQCDHSMKRLRFHRFSYFAQNTDIHLSGKTPKLHDWPIMGSQPLVQWTTSFFLSYQDCHLFRLQHRDQRISKILAEKLGLLSDPVTTRSDKHACGKLMLTDPDKQTTGNCEPAYDFFRRDIQGGSNARHS